MSYSIHYHLEKELSGRERRFCLQIPVAAAMVVLSACMITHILPIETARLRECLLPWTQEQTQTALISFQEDLQSGVSCPDAVTAFCMEILNEADMSQ